MEAKIAIFCLAAVLLGLFVSSAFALPTQQAATITDNGDKISTLTATGSAISNIAPDIAEVNLGIEVQRPDATDAEQEVARIMEAVRTELNKTGIPIEIETGYYAIYPVYGKTEVNPIPTQQKKNITPCPEGELCVAGGENDVPIIVGYRVVHTLIVKSKDTQDVGKLIDAATSAGANEVNGITFTLSDEKKEEATMDALAKATTSAKNKADTIASALGLSVKKVVDISESSFNPVPYKYYSTGVEVASATVTPTDIEPNSVAVSATVTVTFEIG